jgi:Trk K+ transport system NAD-binding subunit
LLYSISVPLRIGCQSLRFYYKGGTVKSQLKGHVIIVGTADAARPIVEQLRDSPHFVNKHVAVIDVDDAHPIFEDPYVYCVSGDPTEDKTLEKAGIDTAETAIILTDWSLTDISLRDSKTALITLAIESKNRDVYTCAEVMRAGSKKHLIRAAVDEPICVADLSQRMLVMAALNHGLSKFFDAVLSFDDGSEICCIEAPERFWGQDFEELFIGLREERGDIVMGIKRLGEGEEEVHVNPKSPFPVEQGDLVYVLSTIAGKMGAEVL